VIVVLPEALSPAMASIIGRVAVLPFPLPVRHARWIVMGFSGMVATSGPGGWGFSPPDDPRAGIAAAKLGR
jgi:hypothetical protein